MHNKNILIAFILLINSSLAFGQVFNADVQRVRNGLSIYNGEMNAGTARYIGMGNSMGALGGDLSAINTNPASSAIFIKGNATLTFGVDNIKNKTTFGSSLTTDNSNFNINQAGFVFVADLNDMSSKFNSISFGINAIEENIDDEVYFPTNSNITFPVLDPEDNSLINTYTFNGLRDYRNGEKAKINFNIGTNYDDKIFLGLNLNYHYAHFNHSIRYSEFDDASQTFVYDAYNTPYNEISGGFSAGIGIIGKLNHNVRVGLAYNTPVWWNNIESEYIFYDLNNNSSQLNYFNRDKVTGAGKITTSGALVLDNLALNIDYNYHFNKSTTLRPNSAFIGENDFIDTYVKNTSEIKIGGEYRIKDFRLRGGLGFIESPMKDVSYSNGTVNGNSALSNNATQDLFIGKRTQFSLGLGYNFGNFYMDIAYQNTKQDYNYIMNGTFVDKDFYSVDITDNLLGEISKTTNNYFLTLGWNF